MTRHERRAPGRGRRELRPRGGLRCSADLRRKATRSERADRKPVSLEIWSAVFCLFLGLSVGPSAGAQLSSDESAAIAPPEDRIVSHARVLVANTTLAALSSGAIARARGGSFWRGAKRGALGGVLTYAGKRVATRPWRGAGFLGREVAAAGATLMRQAQVPDTADRVPWLFPVGPLHVYIGRRAPEESRVRVKVHAATALVAMFVSFDDGTRWDPRASLSSGMLVFRDSRWSGATLGYQEGGVIGLREDRLAHTAYSAARRRATFAHERVHVVQDDFSFAAWSAPAEGWLLARLPGGDALARYVDLGLQPLMPRLVARLVRYEDRPWEQEAAFLARTR